MRNLKRSMPSDKTSFSPKKKVMKITNRDFAGQSSDCMSRDVNNHEIIQYFREICSQMEEGSEGDGEKGSLVDNVLEQTSGHEIDLSCNCHTGRYIEKFLDYCNNPYVVIRFMEAFSRDLNTVCMDQCASHIAEKLLQRSLSVIHNLFSATEPSDVGEKENIKQACLFWACKWGEFFCQNLELCLSYTYSCHVLSAAIQFLGCCQIDESAFSSKKSHTKEHATEKYAGRESISAVREIFPTIPEAFMDLLKQIAMGIAECDQLSDLISDSSSSHVIQILLLVLKKKNLPCFEKVKQILLSVIFSRRNHEGVPLALCDRSCSYLVEKIMELSDEHEQELLWMGISPCLLQLVLHPIGNHIIQKFYSAVHSKQQFESMFDVTITHFEDILKNQHFGIWLSIAKSCNRLKTRQVQFLTKIMQVLKCPEPVEKNSTFVLLVLGLETYKEEQKMIPVASQLSSLSINLFGSLILQEILKFSKPFKVVRSILSMTSEMLKFLACQQQGCHVLISFLESTSIARKDKEKLVQQLKPEIASIACNFTGNFTLCQMWPLLSLEQKTTFGKQLSSNKSVLLQNKCGATILKKFAIFHLEHNLEKWEEIQQSFEKKKQMLKEIIG